MQIERIVVENYGSLFGHHTFSLNNRGLTFVCGDNQDEPRMNSNGAGKSTIFDALDWGLFGVIPKEDHVDSIINDEVNRCNVVVHLNDDGIPLVVDRSKERGKSGTIKYWKNGQLVETLDPKETQRLLELELGLDREVFHATVLYGQNDVFHFADTKSDTKRMEVITKILQLSEIDDLLASTKEIVKALDNEIASHRFELAQVEGQLTVLLPQVDSIQVESQKWENERAAALQASIKQLDGFKVNIEKAQAVVALEDRVKAMTSVLNPMGATVYDWGDFDRRIADARAIENNCIAKLSTTELEGKNTRAKLNSLGTGVCSECGQELPNKEHIEAETLKLEARVETLRQQYLIEQQALQVAIQKREGIEDQKEEVRQQHLEAEKDLAQRDSEAKAQLREIEQAKQYLAEAQNHVANLQQLMAETHAKVNPWLVKGQEIQQQIQSAQVKQNELTVTIETKLDSLQYYEFWKVAFGPKGLKSYILDARLQELTDAVNQWVNLLTGGTYWVRFESQTMGRSTKALSNKINIRVFNYNPNGSITERNFRSYSGGQKKRISWAVDFGLSRLIAARAKKSYDLLVLDEVFKHVDEAGGEAVIEMLNCLRKEKSSIFVIEHDSTFESQFENRVLVRLKNRRTSIIEDYDHGKEEGEEKNSDGGKENEAQSTGKKKRHPVPCRVTF